MTVVQIAGAVAGALVFGSMLIIIAGAFVLIASSGRQ